MKKTIASQLVTRVIWDNWKPKIDIERCHSVVDILCQEMPEIKADTVEEADALVKRVMEWERSLPDKSIGAVVLNSAEFSFMTGLFQSRYDAMHLAVEQLLFDMGLVESGETDAQASDT